MTESTKRTECVKVCFTEREYIDLNRAAALDGRSKADMVYWFALQGMYGRLNRPARDAVGTQRD